jgi:hypothetical protein
MLNFADGFLFELGRAAAGLLVTIIIVVLAAVVMAWVAKR